MGESCMKSEVNDLALVIFFHTVSSSWAMLVTGTIYAARGQT